MVSTNCARLWRVQKKKKPYGSLSGTHHRLTGFKSFVLSDARHSGKLTVEINKILQFLEERTVVRRGLFRSAVDGIDHALRNRNTVIEILFIHQLMQQWVVFKIILIFTLKLTFKQLHKFRCCHTIIRERISSCLLRLELWKQPINVLAPKFPFKF